MVVWIVAGVILALIAIGSIVEWRRTRVRRALSRLDDHGLPDVRLAHEIGHLAPDVLEWILRDDPARRRRR